MLSLAISKLNIRLENDRRGYFEGEVGLFNLGEDPIKCDQGSLVLNIIYRDGQKLTANPILSGLEGKFPLMKGQSAVVSPPEISIAAGGRGRTTIRPLFDQSVERSTSRDSGGSANGTTHGTTGGFSACSERLVGAPRFELGTPCTPCKCATRLRHAPISVSLSSCTRRAVGEAPRGASIIRRLRPRESSAQ